MASSRAQGMQAAAEIRAVRTNPKKGASSNHVPLLLPKLDDLVRYGALQPGDELAYVLDA